VCAVVVPVGGMAMSKSIEVGQCCRDRLLHVLYFIFPFPQSLVDGYSGDALRAGGKERSRGLLGVGQDQMPEWRGAHVDGNRITKVVYLLTICKCR
jgi:hypothetical protein